MPDKLPEITHFRKVLIANRGEISRRILRSLREMGIPSVAVFSEADEHAPHVAEADEAVYLGPAESSKSYLDTQAVIAAAQAVGADAIHPGYGFLAENAAFAEHCAKAGIVFIGPSPEAIRRMGHKAEAKALAEELGVPVLGGIRIDGSTPREASERAADLAYPLMIKAAAGGGGKGMRVVHHPQDLATALEGAAREAAAAFDDDSLMLERYLPACRHVEVQILADAHGHVVHAFERECSVQRRHQKIFEEAPSPAVDPDLRSRLGEAAVALARAVQYRGVGTVEFLLDAEGRFYFLEMNTRLQVEHSVTEAVTGLDLVRCQVEIAQGSALPFSQDGLDLSGHAIEARLYAEDPANEFLPATGTVCLWRLPEQPGLRIDSAIEEGAEIGIWYDPLLAKVIAHGQDRAEALRRLRRALSELALGGVANNREFLLAALDHEAFRAAELDTSFVEKKMPQESRRQDVDPEILALHGIVAALYLFRKRRQRPNPVPNGVPAGWRNHLWRAPVQAFEHTQGRLEVRYQAEADDRFWVETALGSPDESASLGQLGQLKRPRRRARLLQTRTPLDRPAAFGLAHAEALLVEVDGIRRRFHVGCQDSRRPSTVSTADRPEGPIWVHGLGQISSLHPVPRFPPAKASAIAGGCLAPMTGKVVEVLVEEGQQVEAGTALVVLEAMKMEHRLESRGSGLVREVRVKEGQMVDPDHVLIVVDELPEP